MQDLGTWALLISQAPSTAPARVCVKHPVGHLGDFRLRLLGSGRIRVVELLRMHPDQKPAYFVRDFPDLSNRDDENLPRGPVLIEVGARPTIANAHG